jgi:hypothetical protein
VRVSWRLDGEAERLAPSCNGRREARVEVDDPDVIDADAGEVERLLAAELDRRRAGERVPRLETYGCSWQSVPDAGNTQRDRGSAQPLGRLHGAMMIAAPMSTSLLSSWYLRYGSRQPVGRDVVRISSATWRRGSTRRVVVGDGAEADHSSLDAHEVVLGRPGGGGSDRALEHRIDLHR